MIEVMSALTCQLAGVDPINPRQGCLGVDSASGKIGFLQKAGLPDEALAKSGGAIGFMGNMIATLYTPPLHTADYFQNLAQNFGINKKAYAQTTGGTGFQGLSPLINVWSAFRNIVYLFLVIVFIVIGLAIMLRIKIDPRTVMSIQNQIPKIIIGILVVTFSFAIAGFLIDLMWVSIYLIYGIISGISPDIAKSVSQLNPTLLQGKSPFTTGFGDLSGMVNNVATGSKEVIQGLLGISPEPTHYIPFLSPIKDIGGFLLNLTNKVNMLNLPPAFVPDAGTPANFLIDLISSAASIFAGIKIMGWDSPSVGLSAFGFGADVDLGWITNLPVAGVIAGIIYPFMQELLREALPHLIVYIIIFIALLIALFRLWFTLLMAYVQILLAVVLAPFWIIGGIIPGSPISFSGWLRDISANLLAFPVTIAMFMLGKVFMDAFKTATNPFAPPLIGDLGNPEMFSSLIGIGFILMTPNVVNMLKTALKAPKLDTGLGKAIGVGVAVPGAAVKQTVGSIFAATRGTMPPPDERGFAAVLRRMFGRT